MNIADKEMLLEELEEHLRQVKMSTPENPFRILWMDKNYRFVYVIVGRLKNPDMKVDAIYYGTKDLV